MSFFLDTFYIILCHSRGTASSLRIQPFPICLNFRLTTSQKGCTGNKTMLQLVVKTFYNTLPHFSKFPSSRWWSGGVRSSECQGDQVMQGSSYLKFQRGLVLQHSIGSDRVALHDFRSCGTEQQVVWHSRRSEEVALQVLWDTRPDPVVFWDAVFLDTPGRP